MTEVRPLTMDYINKKRRDDSKMSKAASDNKKDGSSYTKKQWEITRPVGRRAGGQQHGHPAHQSLRQPQRMMKRVKRTRPMQGQRPRPTRGNKGGISVTGAPRTSRGLEEGSIKKMEAARMTEETMVISITGMNRLVILILLAQLIMH